MGRIYVGFGLAYCSAGVSGPESWRKVWLYAGCAGYCVALLTLLVKEPVRKKKEKSKPKAAGVEEGAEEGKEGKAVSRDRPEGKPKHWFRVLMGSRRCVDPLASVSHTHPPSHPRVSLSGVDLIPRRDRIL